MSSAGRCACCTLLFLAPMIVLGEPIITVYTDSNTYRPGDAIEVSLCGQNDGEATEVDVCIGLFAADGSLYTLGESGWSAALEPWLQDLYIPAQFTMEAMPFLWFDLPCDMPPIGPPGQYYFAAALAYPGTFDWISAPSLASFAVVVSPSLSYYVDGEAGGDTNDGSEETPWKTIAQALDSVDGSQAHPVIIQVASGTYSPSTNGETFPLNMKSWVSLLGQGPNLTKLDAEGETTQLVRCEYVSDLEISGFEMTGVGTPAGPMPEYYGGGIYCFESSPTIANNRIAENSARHGAGIYLNRSAPVIIGNTIADNSSQENGGGIYCFDSRPTIADNLIAGNTALNRGGGIYCLSNSSPPVINNTIVGNSADGGGGVYASPSSYPAIRDSILWDNEDDLVGCSATYSCVEDGNAGTGNIADDPIFVSGPLGGYYLDPSSPCIDAGSRSAEEAGLSDRTTQADGTLDTGTVDMGFHYPVP